MALDVQFRGYLMGQRFESGYRVSLAIYRASVSPNLCCVSTIVRQTAAPSQLMCAGSDALLRVGTFIIVRRNN